MNGITTERRRNTVIISNGHGKFHLIYAAQSAERHGILDQFITAAYPTALLKRVLRVVTAIIPSDRLKRWMLREAEGVPGEKIRTCTLSEPFNQLAVKFPQFGFNGSKQPQLDALAFRIYQRSALRYIRNSKAGLYHCRSGYGGKTISHARSKGMVILVDHSIAHPQALMQLIRNEGIYNPRLHVHLPPMWRLVQDDIETADWILVNSDFVKKTMVDFGCPKDRIIVQYWGIDAEIEKYLENTARTQRTDNSEMKFLFAGGVEKRKGADLLLDVIKKLPQHGWSFTLAGGIEQELKSKIGNIQNVNVKVLGAILRQDLIRLMLDHDVFVFPTLAEGSARVVFEAMASGMAIITTPNAGSVVEHGKHGYLIDPGNRESLYNAIMQCFDNRVGLKNFGLSARELVQNQYHSAVYNDAMATLYSTLLTNK
ncbi:MAG: glycosyltransferase family 4 protein [Bacteroidota bacterium]